LEIHNLQLSDLSDKQHNIADIREEYKKDKQSLREKVLTQTAKIESTLASCSKNLLDTSVVLTPIDGQENQMMEIGVSQLVCQFDESLAFSSQ
jgi:hypothetical protein